MKGRPDKDSGAGVCILYLSEESVVKNSEIEFVNCCLATLPAVADKPRGFEPKTNESQLSLVAAVPAAEAFALVAIPPYLNPKDSTLLPTSITTLS